MSQARWADVLRDRCYFQGVSFTVVSWNIDGATRALIEGGLASQLDALGSPDVLCLQEVRVRASDEVAIGALAAIVPGYTCHVSLNRDLVNARFRGGRTYGVATFVREPATAYVPSWDREGRVAVVELAHRKLAIANVYAVNGTSKPYTDPDGIVRDRHQWKRRVQELIAGELAALLARGLDVIAIGDWNVSQARIDVTPRLRTEEPHALARAQFRELFAERLGMIDVFRARHPDVRAYTWRLRKRRTLDAARVDFALVSRALEPRVIDTRILEDAHGPSDHAPILVTLA
jgi:exodeoxyribonuclease III